LTNITQKIKVTKATDSFMTEILNPARTLHTEKDNSLQPIKVIAFTHRTTPLNELGRFFLDEQNHDERLLALKVLTGIEELLYLSTCNRIEFVFTHSASCNKDFLKTFFKNFNSDWSEEEIQFAVEHAAVFEGEDAIRHIFRVASSLDSMVIGEREIITQVRNAYDRCKAADLTGDFIRLIIKNTITTAKQVFTNTRIAENPVSIVSLAFRKLKNLKVSSDARFLVIGAGETNSNLCKYLFKHGYSRFTIFNRTLSKAERLAELYSVNGVVVKAHPLCELENYKDGFDVLVTCTGSAEPVVTRNIYHQLLNGDTSKKTIIDLAMPADVEEAVITNHSVRYIGLNELREEAERNMTIRQSELVSAEKIIESGYAEFQIQMRTRELELKMRNVPEKIREIKSRALNDVFAREIETLDEQSKDLLSRVLDYMEKKYISVPMIMAKEILLEDKSR
jgi:glutamyl-tRNA reductase